MPTEDFPVEIDLGREMKDVPMPASVGDGKPAKNGKTRKSYPTLYLSGIEGLRNLPKDGMALIYFHRNRIGIVDRENDNNGPMGSNGDEAEIEVRKLCLPEDMGANDGEDMESAMKKFAKDKGVSDTGDAAEETDETEPDNEDGEG